MLTTLWGREGRDLAQQLGVHSTPYRPSTTFPEVGLGLWDHLFTPLLR